MMKHIDEKLKTCTIRCNFKEKKKKPIEFPIFEFISLFVAFRDSFFELCLSISRLKKKKNKRSL